MSKRCCKGFNPWPTIQIYPSGINCTLLCGLDDWYHDGVRDKGIQNWDKSYQNIDDVEMQNHKQINESIYPDDDFLRASLIWKKLKSSGCWLMVMIPIYIFFIVENKRIGHTQKLLIQSCMSCYVPLVVIILPTSRRMNKYIK